MSTSAKFAVECPSGELPPDDVLFGVSKPMLALRQICEKVALVNVPILVTGETGTGKEILTRYIHAKSPWRESPFFKLNSPMLRGSLYGDDPLSKAMIDMVLPLSLGAVGSPNLRRTTLFLDEIALLDPAWQIRLLERLLESPLLLLSLPEGDRLEFRVICATSRHLETEVDRGAFLRDLNYLIKVVTLALPPLRQRANDIPQLVSYFHNLYNRKFSLERPLPSQSVLDRMREYDWPGNVRQLENLILRYVVQGSEDAFVGELGSREPARSHLEREPHRAFH